MKKYFSIYKESLRVSLVSATTYRTDFILHSIITLLSNIIFPLVTVLIYQSGVGFPGWSMYQVLLIQSIFTLSTGISDMLFSGVVWTTMGHVQEGTLEIVLIKPVDSMFYILASTSNVGGIGVVVGGFAVFVISFIKAGISSSWLMWGQMILFFAAGLMVMLGVQLLMAATSFKWVANSRIPEMYGSVLRFGNYPQTIFNKFIIALTSFIIPVGMIGYYPAAALLGKTVFWMYISIVPCVLFMIFGIWVYRYMVRLYEGVGG